MTNFTPTPEQTNILQGLSLYSTLIIEALAGTGKSSTLALCAAENPKRSILYLAFNKKIVEEMERKLPPLATIKTLNSFGHSALDLAIGRRLRLDVRKPYHLLTQLLEAKKFSLVFDEKNAVVNLMNAARTFNMRPDSLDWDFLWDWTELTRDETLEPFVIDLFKLSIKEAELGYIDFTDQIFMPVYLSLKLPKTSLLLVDEAQDMSELNLAFIDLIPATQQIFCGDPNQAIYAFRGAASDSMSRISANYPDAQHYPLTLTFRCPQAIVVRAQQFVPTYRAHESNPTGSVIHWKSWDHTDLPPKCAVICRNNAPLISLALKLLSEKIPVVILGKEFSTGLIRDIKKACNTNCSIAEIETSLRKFYSDKLKGPSSPGKMEKIMEKLDAILAAGESCEDRDSLISTLETLFSNTQSTITLCSGHKSKGLEWDFTVHLSPELIPSKWAVKSGDPTQLQQEANLRYVIETRSKDTLVLASLSDYGKINAS